MTASLLSTFAAIIAGLILGEIAAYLLVDNDQPEENDEPKR